MIRLRRAATPPRSTLRRRRHAVFGCRRAGLRPRHGQPEGGDPGRVRPVRVPGAERERHRLHRQGGGGAAGERAGRFGVARCRCRAGRWRWRSARWTRRSRCTAASSPRRCRRSPGRPTGDAARQAGPVPGVPGLAGAAAAGGDDGLQDAPDLLRRHVSRWIEEPRRWRGARAPGAGADPGGGGRVAGGTAPRGRADADDDDESEGAGAALALGVAGLVAGLGRSGAGRRRVRADPARS